MKIKQIKFFTIILLSLFIIGCQSDKVIVEEPAELLKINSQVDIDDSWTKKIFSNLATGKTDLVIDADGIFSFSSSGLVSSYSINGKLNWKKNLNIDLSSGVGKSFDSLFVTSIDGEVFSLDFSDGNLNWSSAVEGESLSVPSSNGDIVAVQTTNGKITALNLKDGKFRWEYVSVLPSLSLRGSSSPIFDDGALYVGFANGNLAKIEPRSGVVEWEIPITISKGSSEIERIIDVDSKPSVSSGIAFAASYQGDVSAINVLTGRVIWRKSFSTTKDVLEVERNVYVVDEESEIQAFSGLTGVSLWKTKDYRLRNLTSPVRSKNYLVVGDYEGYLHFLDINSGSTIGRYRVSRSGILSLKTYKNSLVCLDISGRLTYLEVK
ncbi:MAG: outer membrane protein assembly factor BamB [Pseudomonadota bacterium]|nr:outer membrane protein assembly factor BamB [Pseudomonadota bacterium]MEC8108069.1 outer membrane protein assembly factor BamB [Pseudomonadota bacterium]